MNIFLASMMILFLICGSMASWSDTIHGIIPNRLLQVFFFIGLILNIILYAFYLQDLLLTFLVNIMISIILGYILFSMKIWAGGDSKFYITLSWLYPSYYLLNIGGTTHTLFVPVVFSFLIGYLYLILANLFSRKNNPYPLSSGELATRFIQYLKTYLTIFLILFWTQMILILFLKPMWNTWLAWFCTLLVCALGLYLRKNKAIHNKYLLPLLLLVSGLIWVINPSLLSYINFQQVLLIMFLSFLQIWNQPFIYETIPTSQVQKGMILSTVSSLQMQKSRVKGLPAVSTETLASRLSAEQAESVKRWESSKYGQPNIVILRKIPFAVFIFLGFLAYWLIWRFF